tara:strand:- start:1281 stop:5324 length:4044 start_codon:yes stop_codon:yes gene_type:complete
MSVENQKFSVVGSSVKYDFFLGNTKKINPRIKKYLKEGKNLVLPSNYVIDTKKKTVIPISNKGGITKAYKKAITEYPKQIRNNPKQLQIYNQHLNLLVDKTDYLTKSNRLKQLSKVNDYIFRDGQLLKRDIAKFTVGKAVKKHNGLSYSRIYKIPKNAQTGEYVNQPPNNIKDFVNSIKIHYQKDFTENERSRTSQRVLLKFGNEFRYIPIDALNEKNLGKKLDNWDKFKVGEQKIGSDVSLGENQDYINSDLLDMTFFRIVMRGKIQGGANRKKCETLYWKTNQPPTNDNLCLEGAINRGLNLNRTAKTLRQEIVNWSEGEITKTQMIDINEINIYESYFECCINVYEDTPHQNGNIIVKSEMEYEEEIDILIKEEHYYLIIGKKFQISEMSENDKSKLGIEKAVKIPKTKEKKKDLTEKLCIFDIETVFDREDDQYLKSYGVSWFIWDANEKFDYESGWNIDRTENKYHNEPYCYYEKGEGCLTKLIEFLISAPEGIIYKPIGFNNSRFDNFAYCEEALNMGVLRNVFFADGTILYCAIEGTRPSWDASRFLTGLSLDSACKSYNTNPKKRTDLIDHYEIQCYFEKNGWGGLTDLIAEKPELELYNKIDCICLLDLVLKMRSSYDDMFGFDIFESFTLSSMSYKILNEKWTDKKALQAKLCGVKDKAEKQNIVKSHKTPYEVIRAEDYKTDKFWRNSLTAGRTQSFYGRITLDMDCAMVDVKSLYPTVLGSYGGNDCPFPYGNYNFTDKEVVGKCGIYRVDINHQKCKWKTENIGNQFLHIKEKYGYDLSRVYAPNVIPRRSEDKPLDWFYKGKIESVYLTSVDIEVLRWATEDKNCITVYEGYYWSEKSSKLFYDFLDPPKKEKTKQDRLKYERKKIVGGEDEKIKIMYEKFGEDYNEAKREGSKGISNSVSGKLLEAIHEDVSDMFSCKKFLEMEKDKDISELEILDFGNNFSIITGKKTEEKVFSGLKDKKPSHLGMFCYSYARKLMYKKLLSRYVVLYMDTDSACMPLSEFDRMNNCKYNIEEDLIDNGEYGCLEEEVCDNKWCEECADREERNDRKEIMEYRKYNRMVNGKRCEKCIFIPANKLIAISPKNYLVENTINQNLTKRKFKGVRKNDFWLPLSYFGDYEIGEKENKNGEITKFIDGEAYDNITDMTQDEIRRFREYKCCKDCINDLIDSKDNPKWVNNCKECNDKKSIMKKTYTTEMFEYLVRGEKIAIFCSMINRIKYNVKQIIDWEYTEKIDNGGIKLSDFEYIVNNHKIGNDGKNPICLKFNLDKEETEIYFKNMETVFNKIKSLSISEKDKDKKFNMWFKENRKFKNCNEERMLTESFKLKQTFMIKII